MGEVVIRLERPASLTPELRAWIGRRVGTGRAMLTRGRRDGADRGALLLRVDLDGLNGQAREEVTDLLTDLRLLGLRPTVISDDLA